MCPASYGEAMGETDHLGLVGSLIPLRCLSAGQVPMWRLAVLLLSRTSLGGTSSAGSGLSAHLEKEEEGQE